ncbi:MAG: hypothetical protein H6621_02220 [Halobacteriovoraceae bacterium]|nr:hypothetical protein [Halobacteriovoraceae bacterium]MCB9093859.1 hypothetical protein [Halobacteriovoraceae bacterium]
MFRTFPLIVLYLFSLIFFPSCGSKDNVFYEKSPGIRVVTTPPLGPEKKPTPPIPPKDPPKPDDPIDNPGGTDSFFDPALHNALNLGGAIKSAVSVYEDATEVFLNGISLATLNKGETYEFLSKKSDLLTSDKPFFVSGKLIGKKDKALYNANIVWSYPEWASTSFSFSANRKLPTELSLYTFTNEDIDIYSGTQHIRRFTVNSHELLTLQVPNKGAYHVVSKGVMLGYAISLGKKLDKIVDAHPVLPPYEMLIGFPSRKAIVSGLDQIIYYDGIYSNGVSTKGKADLGEYDVEKGLPNNGICCNFFYNSKALRIFSTEKFFARSNADGSGWASSPFLPEYLMRKNYTLNIDTQWVAIASTTKDKVKVWNPKTLTTTLHKLEREGFEFLGAPTQIKIKGLSKGTIISADFPFAVWIQPKDSEGSVDQDEMLVRGVGE